MKCNKKNKNCGLVLCIKAKQGNYICSGVNTKPTKYSKDNIWLCFKGQETKDMAMEMTKDEALMIVSALSLSVAKDKLT